MTTLHHGVRLTDEEEVAYFDTCADLLRVSNLYICQPGRNLAIRYLNFRYEEIEPTLILKVGFEGHHRPLFEVGLGVILKSDEDEFDGDCVRTLGFLASEIQYSRVKMDMRHRRETLQDLEFYPDEHCAHPDVCHRQGTILWRRWTLWRLDTHYFDARDADRVLRVMRDDGSSDDGSNDGGREMCEDCFEWFLLFGWKHNLLLDTFEVEREVARIVHLVYFEDEEQK